MDIILTGAANFFSWATQVQHRIFRDRLEEFTVENYVFPTIPEDGTIPAIIAAKKELASLKEKSRITHYHLFGTVDPYHQNLIQASKDYFAARKILDEMYGRGGALEFREIDDMLQRLRLDDNTDPRQYLVDVTAVQGRFLAFGANAAAQPRPPNEESMGFTLLRGITATSFEFLQNHFVLSSTPATCQVIINLVRA